MKLVRFLSRGRLHEGQWLDDGTIVDEAGRVHAQDDITFLPPFEAKKVIGLALNFADHAAELGLERPDQPAIFALPTTSLIGHRCPVVFPKGAEYLHYEVELAVVIGRRGRRISPDDALDYVRGYTIANDVTVRDYITNTFRPPLKAKGWDTFTPVGPYLAVDEIEDPGRLDMRVFINGELRQEGNTKDLIYTIPELISYISEFATLEKGDVILTGTPEGISRLKPGDVMELEIDGLGRLVNPLVAEDDAG